MNKKGLGVEDTSFMILAAVLVMLVTAGIAGTAMMSFLNDNERQTAFDSASEIYKRARMISLAYEGSSDAFDILVPPKYGIRIDGEISALEGAFFDNGSLNSEAAAIASPYVLEGVKLQTDDEIIPPGEHTILLEYSLENGREIYVSWE
jgi:hypothetical protein